MPIYNLPKSIKITIRNLFVVILLSFSLLLLVKVISHYEKVSVNQENPFLKQIIRERKIAKTNAKFKTLNYFMPSFVQLAEFAKTANSNSNTFNPNVYLNYYNRIVEFFPSISDAYDMLGFCYYHLGELDKAVANYETAASINSNYFWTYYNLGIIYLKMGNSSKALINFNKGLQANPEVTLKTIAGSKVYQQIISGLKETKYSFSDSLKSGYARCHFLLSFCREFEKKAAVLSGSEKSRNLILLMSKLKDVYPKVF